MKIQHNFLTAIGGLRTNKARSILTILGIVIGIMAIIIIVSLGQGAQNLILGQIQSIGAKTIAVVPGRETSGPSDFLSVFADSLKERDLQSLERPSNVPYATRIMPIVFGSETVSYAKETYRPTIYGLGMGYQEMYDIEIGRGRTFTPDEILGYADVVVIGTKVSEELFAQNDPVDVKIKIGGRNFRVIGLMAKKGQASFVNFDDAVIIPYTTAQRYVFGIKHYNRLVVEADTEEHVEDTVKDITITLRNNHNITDPEKDDFFVETQVDALNTVKTVTDTLTLFLAAVAAISLLVGGIGIMNIMLVSVTERTREIGLRKAVGATESNILTQFLLESITLTGIGGLIGITLGALISYALSLIISQAAGIAWGFTFPWSAAALGLAVASGVGLVFGLYPARQAAKKNPIEALRYE